MRARILLRLVLVVLPTVGLMLIWLAFLPRQGQASSFAVILQPAGEQVPTQAPTPAATPDPRWMEIVRTQGSGGGASLDAALPTINLNLTDAYVAGRVPYPSTVELALKDQGELLTTWYATPVPEGGSFIYWVSLYLEPQELQQGYELWVTQGAATISMTIPILTGLAYPQTDILSGTAPTNAELFAYLFPYADPEHVYTATATANGDGTYQLPWAPAVDLQPRDGGYLLYIQDAARQACIRYMAPSLGLQVGGFDLFGTAAPLSWVSVVVEDEAGVPFYNYSTSTDVDGLFSAGFCSGSYPGDGILFAPGQRVIATAAGQVFSMTVLTLSAHADPQAGQVVGQAPAGQPVEVMRFAGPLTEYGRCFWQELQPLSRQTVTATVDGMYTAGLPLEAGNYGFALITTADGYQQYARYAASYLHVTLGEPLDYLHDRERIWGQVEQPFVPVTVEVQGPSGYLKDWFVLTSYAHGYFTDRRLPWLELTLESGDRLTLTSPHTPLMSLLLPVLTAEAVTGTNIIAGQAPPFSQLVVTIDDTLQVTVTADAAGQYSADFDPLGGFYPYSRGEVVWISAEGFSVARLFRVGPSGGEMDCPPVLRSAQVHGNLIALSGYYLCEDITLRLREAGGQVKYEHFFPNMPWDSIPLVDGNDRPVLILPGDRIEIIAEEQVQTTLVPPLVLSLDPHTDLAYGQAPPLAVVALGDIYPEYLTVTADIQGAFSADLSALIDLDAGYSLRATLPGTPQFYTFGVIPVLKTTLYSRGIWGRLDPLTPFTITFSTPVTTTGPYTGYAEMSGAYGDYQDPVYPPPGSYTGKPGEIVTVETPGRFWQLIQPALTARLDALAGTLSGEAPPSSRLAIDMDIGEDLDYRTIVTATGSGTYSINFPLPAEQVNISGEITHFTTFDMRTSLRFTTPTWFVEIGFPTVSGYVPELGVPITFTLHASDGAISQEITGPVSDFGFWITFDRPIHPGDRLTMQTSSGQVSEFIVPNLIAVHDFVRRVLEGQAPGGGTLTAAIPTDHAFAYRNIRLLPDGRYGVDTSDLDTIVGMQGSVTFTDRLGNTVTQHFMIRGFPGYLPLIRLLAGP